MLKHQLNHEFIDLMSVSDQYYGHVAEVHLLSDEDLLTDTWKGLNLTKDDINSMSKVILLTESAMIKIPLLGNMFTLLI